MIYVCNLVGNAHAHTLERGGMPALLVVENAVAYLKCEVQAPSVLFEHVDNAHRLHVVLKAARGKFVKDALPAVTEGRVSQVVPQRRRLGKVLV